MALAFGSLLALPAWADSWSATSIQSLKSYLSSEQEALLAEITETILPATNTPGAKDLKIYTFVHKMIADCYEPEVQENVVKGLATAEQLAKQTYAKTFATCDTKQREEILTTMEISIDPNWASFYKLVKDLTLQGYLTSEYYLTNHTNYKMIPGHFYGCVPAPTPQAQLQK
ncbi:hypothetical protein AHMF7616_00045 [Adhaeribacter pallidiroseus]|uniref:Gluconate 2-dehydrogenase (Acceptor) n=2 Tax=Adhaeribacter pallidiroseus TaxID=2072847 RepID=A0A369QE32_9BACT|nr:hypothetical protein AHMF7616_00045 [Adhaeribacter pallidiroseus]